MLRVALEIMIEKLMASSTIQREEFELNTHQMFSVHSKLEKLENATVPGHFRFVFDEKLGQE